MFRTKSTYWSVLLMVLMLALPFSAAAQDEKRKAIKTRAKRKNLPASRLCGASQPTSRVAICSSARAARR